MAFSEIETTTLKECVRLLNRGGWTVRQYRVASPRGIVHQAVRSAELVLEDGKPVSLTVVLGTAGEPLRIPTTAQYPCVTVRLIDGKPTIIKVHGRITFLHRANFDHAQAPFKPKP